MDQGRNDQRRRGAVDKANDLVRTGRSAYEWGNRAYKAGRAVVVAAEGIAAGGWAVIIVVAVILIFVFIIVLVGGGGGVGGIGLGDQTGIGGPGPGNGNGEENGGSIALCTFYRSGDGIQFGNPDMALFVESVSAKVGVPAAIVAGIMRVESGGNLAKTDPTYFTSDYDAHSSGVAYGIMQIVPSTFTGVFNNNSVEMNSLFGKTQVRSVIDSETNVYPANYLRIYSIRDSIIATAFLIKNNKQSLNGDGPWDKATVSAIAGIYYSGQADCTKYGDPNQPNNCRVGPYDYGEDVWKSYTSCKSTSPTSSLASCPIPSATVISCGSFMSDPKYNGPACSGPQPIDRGHCGRTYDLGCFKDTVEATSYSRRAHSIDVPSPPGTIVYLPALNGKETTWNYGSSFDVIAAGGGYGHVFTSIDGSDVWILYLLHTTAPPLTPPSSGSTYKSGDAVTKIANTNFPHLHVNIGKNTQSLDGGTGWYNPEDLGMCI